MSITSDSATKHCGAPIGTLENIVIIIPLSFLACTALHASSRFVAATCRKLIGACSCGVLVGVRACNVGCVRLGWGAGGGTGEPRVGDPCVQTLMTPN